MGMGNAYPVVCTVPGTQIVVGQWTQQLAAGSNLSLAAGDISSGILSVARISVGRHRISFAGTGPKLLSGIVVYAPASVVVPLVPTVNFSTFVAATTVTPATLDFTLWAMNTGTWTLTDLPTNDKVTFMLRFAKNVQA